MACAPTRLRSSLPVAGPSTTGAGNSRTARDSMKPACRFRRLRRRLGRCQSPRHALAGDECRVREHSRQRWRGPQNEVDPRTWLYWSATKPRSSSQARAARWWRRPLSALSSHTSRRVRPAPGRALALPFRAASCLAGRGREGRCRERRACGSSGGGRSAGLALHSPSAFSRSVPRACRWAAPFAPLPRPAGWR